MLRSNKYNSHLPLSKWDLKPQKYLSPVGERKKEKKKSKARPNMKNFINLKMYGTRKEATILFNSFYLRLYCVGHIAID